MGGADILVAIKRCNNLEGFLDEKINDARPSFNFEQLGSPLLSHVGIIDINKAINSLDAEAQQALRELYNVGGMLPVNSICQDIVDDITANHRLLNEDISNPPFESSLHWRDLELLQNNFYPVMADGFVGKLANTELWQRLLGVSQLGWDKDYPLANEHSRGMHSLFVAVNIARVLQSLYSKSPYRLISRLRNDFSEAGLFSEDQTDQELLQLAVKLGALVGMSHDIYTPAGGDMMKGITGLDEEADIKKLQTKAEDQPESEYLDVMRSYGLTDVHVDFLINCVQGNSSSLIGEMIHSEKGDVLEQDRLAYTVQDLFAAGVLGPALPRSFFEGEGMKDEVNLASYFNEARSLLSDENTRVIGPVSIGDFRPSLTMLDVSDDYMLDDSFSIVCTRPDKLLWLAAFRAMMSAEFYQGAKLRGQEHDFSEVIKKLREEGELKEVLSEGNLLNVTNQELAKQLKASSFPELSQLLHDMSNVIYPHTYESHLMSDASDFGDDWLKLPIKIKPGLDTDVLYEGRVITLGEYAALERDSLASSLLDGILSEFKGKTRVVKRQTI